jgi:hypothetical protein
MEASAEREGGFIDLSRLSLGELGGMLSALVLGVSLFLPWFSTSSSPHSNINPAETFACCGIENTGPSDQATAWQTFPILRWLLLLACIAPFILTWIIARGHDLTWKPGEVTMIVGMIAFVLILCNGVILGKPEPNIEISFSYGYLVALLASVGLLVAGYIRQAFHTDAKKPPGVL